MFADWPTLVNEVNSRLVGPLHLRMYMQPAMAVILGIRDGARDAGRAQPAYFWALFTNPVHRRELFKSGLRAVAKVLVLAFILDSAYQLIAEAWLHPLEALLVALTLAFIPYLMIRGPANRVLRWWSSRQRAQQPGYGAPR